MLNNWESIIPRYRFRTSMAISVLCITVGDVQVDTVCMKIVRSEENWDQHRPLTGILGHSSRVD